MSPDTVYQRTDEDAERLREPHGDIVEGDELIDELQERDYHRLVCVGDRVAIDVAESDIEADITIIDGKIEREPVNGTEHEAIDADLELAAQNPAGEITEDAWNTVREAFAHTCSVQLTVDGEEDLLALPSIVFAAPDSLIVYGHWQEGAVILEPDAAMKEFAREIVGFQPFPRVIVGGSWDQFHAGHRYLLLAALENGEHVDVGVTTDNFLEDKLGHDDFTPYDERRKQVETFLNTFAADQETNIIALDDIYGNTLEVDRAVLMATDETLDSAKQVNEKRLDKQKTPLNLAALDRITAEDGDVISASRIREGVIDRDGRNRNA